MEGSASSKVRAAFDKAGGKRSAAAAKEAAHKVGKANDLEPHTVRSMLSRWMRGETSRKSAKSAPKRQARKAAPKRQVRKAAKAVKTERPVRVAKKAAA